MKPKFYVNTRSCKCDAILFIIETHNSDLDGVPSFTLLGGVPPNWFEILLFIGHNPSRHRRDVRVINAKE